MKVKLGDICDIIKGKTTITKAIEGEYPLVVTGENRLSNSDFQFDCSAVCVPLVSATGHGHASIKRIHYQEGKFALGSILAAVIPKSTEEVNTRYLHIYLSYFKDSVLVPLMRGSANVSLTIKSLGSAEIELPPIDKQLEIVRLISKVEEMKGEMDKYIIDQENIVLNIKKETLQLAVQGKLVPQDPNDEPAEVLLEKIREEKERLIKEKKIKKEKPLAEISEEEKPFELPKGWKWIRLGEVIQFINGYAFKSNTYVEKSNNQIIRLGNVKNEGLILDKKDIYIPDNIADECENYIIFNNDILVTMTGTRNKRDYFFTYKVCENDLIEKKLFLNQRVGLIRNYIAQQSDFLSISLKANYILNRIFESETGTANQGNIGVKAISELVIPIPPLEEQKRIVEKVNSLIILCDELENKIQKQKDYSNRLMESILKSSL